MYDTWFVQISTAPVDILTELPSDFQEMVASKKWQERKEGLEDLLKLATDNIRLDPKANYNEIVDTLSKILAKDADINVCAIAAKCITQLAKGLRTKFGPHVSTFTPIIFIYSELKKLTINSLI
uniref:Uncharacterized protein n=1 Tax=Panagrolaimus sp. ES5 TaxID=591445 RepID=A0AC34GHQ2_9BILA